MIIKKFLKELEIVFYKTTGMTFSYSDLKSKGDFEFFPAQERASFCKIIQSAPGGRKRCFQSDSWGTKRTREKGSPSIYRCHAGLIDATVPLVVKGEFIGTLLTGQVITEAPNEKHFNRIIEKTKGSKVDLDKLKKAYFELKVFPKETLEVAVQLLSFVANYIIERENILILQKKLIGQQKRIIYERREKDRFKKRMEEIAVFLKSENQEADISYRQKIVEEVKSFIQKNYSHQIRLKEVAKICLLSPSYLCSLFKEEAGLTLHQYLFKIKMEKAKYLLEQSDFSIKQITFKVGYEDPNYFSRTFKDNIGFSPTRYRLIHQIKA